MFSEFYLTIEPEYYIYDYYGDGSICTLLLLSNNYDFFLLGQPVYQGYYTMHDMTRSTIGFAPLRYFEDKPVPYRASIPDSIIIATIPPTYAGLMVVGVCGFIFYMIAVLAIQPLLDTYWSFDNVDDQWKYYTVYVVYALWSIVIIFALIFPMTGIPMSELEKDLASLGLISIGFFKGVKSTFSAAKPSVKSAKNEKKVELEESNGANLLE